jgi:hypothetical protein
VGPWLTVVVTRYSLSEALAGPGEEGSDEAHDQEGSEGQTDEQRDESHSGFQLASLKPMIEWLPR